MYKTIKEFKEDWFSEAQNTIRIMEALTDDSLAAKVSEPGRTLGRLAWHIVVTIPEMGTSSGLKVEGPAPDAPIPTSAREIVRQYKAASDSLLKVIDEWTDESLAGEIDLYGEKWTRSKTLVVLMRHEIHHRAQMTVLMRHAGLRVPGIYGPAYEEWDQYKMPPQE
ncbi:MAG: DinB family protein [Candidatus Kapaibacterium sp.]